MVRRISDCLAKLLNRKMARAGMTSLCSIRMNTLRYDIDALNSGHVRSIAQTFVEGPASPPSTSLEVQDDSCMGIYGLWDTSPQSSFLKFQLGAVPPWQV
jgi:hypothetical protein